MCGTGVRQREGEGERLCAYAEVPRQKRVKAPDGSRQEIFMIIALMENYCDRLLQDGVYHGKSQGLLEVFEHPTVVPGS